MSIHPHPGTSPEADRVLLAALCAVVLTYLVQEVYSLDVWWHLAIGRDILATRSVPRLDQYAAAALGRPYHDSHWLFQVLLASAYRAASWVGVQILQASIWVGALVCTYRAARLWGGVSLSAALTFLAAMACVERFLPRPDSVTVLLVAAFYLLLSGTGMPHRRRAATLAILQVAWVNSHGLFILGPMMAGAYLLEALWPGRKSVAESWKPALTTFLVVLLATLVTPYGVGAWRYAALLLTEVSAPGLVSGLGELSPTFGPAARSSPAFWFFLALLGVTGVGALTAAARRAPVS
ncbi:MAG TPA: hypothetical protein VLA36_07185, partial [Longimicrobiales bacterium]|nr:hypothetical protein [Longimicrobiales bacterium]